MHGLYLGSYGPHGLEIVSVEATEGGALRGVKVTGDPNVPSGECTFVTKGDKVKEAVVDGEEGGMPWMPCRCSFDCECRHSAWEEEGLKVRASEKRNNFAVNADSILTPLYLHSLGSPTRSLVGQQPWVSRIPGGRGGHCLW